MSSKMQLRRAISTLDDAVALLRRAAQTTGSESSDHIRRAIREIEDAESKVKRVMRELPSE
ncbi:MAG: hypothetical protein AAGC76_05055 [Luteibacter sp.]|uniref:hypothetical protein n=1 Tax=Luteibacter sp. TaxID=1886636 RepID=UPI00280998FE|nr:hypothetical protein [Luteibacter sp.]MDQ7995205.1 hypothetical protein [Luteibacter sp.]